MVGTIERQTESKSGLKLTMKIDGKFRQSKPGGTLGFTLAELLMSLALSCVSIGSIVTGYLMVMNHSEWSADATAAQSLAVQRMEQVRAAKWDLLTSPQVDELVAANFPDLTQSLGVPVLGTNIVNATVKTTIRLLSSDPPLKMVQVDCLWTYLNRGTFTNTLFTYRSPDQ